MLYLHVHVYRQGTYDIISIRLLEFLGVMFYGKHEPAVLRGTSKSESNSNKSKKRLLDGSGGLLEG